MIKDDFIPVFVKLPLVLPANDDESKFFHSIYKEKWAAQGLCVTNYEGKVIEWLPLWKDKDEFIELLKKCIAAFTKAPDTKGSINIPEKHTEDKCPLNPKPPKNWLVVDFVGRTIDKGEPSGDGNSQEHYSLDCFGISPELQESVAKAIAEKKEKTKLPDEFIHQILRYAYLGQTDLRPFENPRGAKTEIVKCELTADQPEKNIYMIRGTTDISAKGTLDENKKEFCSTYNIKWEGFLEITEDKKISSIMLYGQGLVSVKWDGYKKDDKTDPKVRLPMGKYFDLNGIAHFGLVAPGKGKATNFAPQGPPQEIQKKMKLLQELVPKQSKETIEAVQKIMQQFEQTIRAGEWEKAEKVLDQALKLVVDKK